MFAHNYKLFYFAVRPVANANTKMKVVGVHETKRDRWWRRGRIRYGETQKTSYSYISDQKERLAALSIWMGRGGGVFGDKEKKLFYICFK